MVFMVAIFLCNVRGFMAAAVDVNVILLYYVSLPLSPLSPLISLPSSPPPKIHTLT